MLLDLAPPPSFLAKLVLSDLLVCSSHIVKSSTKCLNPDWDD